MMNRTGVVRPEDACPEGRICNTAEGWDSVLLSLGVDPVDVDLAAVGPLKCPRRLVCFAAVPADLPAEVAQRVAIDHGRCRRCGLRVFTWKNDELGPVHYVPDDVPERGRRFVEAQTHRPVVGGVAA